MDPGAIWAPKIPPQSTFFASIFSSKIFLISYLFLRPIFNWFLLIFGRIFQSKLCRVCLTFATWSNFKNLDFAWKVLQKWRFGMPGWIPKSIKNRIKIWMKKTLGKSSKNQPKINQKSTKNSLKKWSKNQYICGSVFNRKKFKKWWKNDPRLGAQGGSNEPFFRSLDPSWGHPGAQGGPKAPQRSPRDPPEPK